MPKICISKVKQPIQPIVASQNLQIKVMAAQGALRHLLRARHFSASSQTGRSIASARWLYKYNLLLDCEHWNHPFWFSVSLSLFYLTPSTLSHQNHKVFYSMILWSHCSTWFQLPLLCPKKPFKSFINNKRFAGKRATEKLIVESSSQLLRHGGGEKGIARHVKLNKKVESLALENHPCWRFWWGTE